MAKRRSGFLGLNKSSIGGTIGIFVFGVVVGAGFTLGGILLKGGMDFTNKQLPGIIPEEFNARTAFTNDKNIRFAGYASDYENDLMVNY